MEMHIGGMEMGRSPPFFRFVSVGIKAPQAIHPLKLERGRGLGSPFNQG